MIDNENPFEMWIHSMDSILYTRKVNCLKYRQTGFDDDDDVEIVVSLKLVKKNKAFDWFQRLHHHCELHICAH